MTHLSIIIPATGPQQLLDDTVLSVLENRPEDSEILLVHPLSYVDPYDLRDEVSMLAVDEDENMPLWNAGIQQARGHVAHVLRPGITVAAGWCDPALELFDEDRNIGSAAPCIVAKGSRRTIQGIEYRSYRGKRIVRNPKRSILAPLLGTGFYQTAALRFMHGFDLRYGDYADVELGLRMRSANYKAVKCDSRIHCDSYKSFRTTRGFPGGRQRGELFRTARRLGMATSFDGWMGLLFEPLLNGFGFGAITASIGRMTRFDKRTADATSSSESVTPASDSTRSKRQVG